MNPQNVPYIVVSAIAAGIAVSVAIYAWRQRAAPGGACLVLLMLAVAMWALSTAGEFAAVAVPAKIWWSKVTYLGIVGVAPSWLLFVLDYAQRNEWLAPRRIALLWIVPAITLALVFTNEWHHLIWPRITPASAAPGAILIYDHGIGFWVEWAYSYLLLLLGTILLVRAILRPPRLYRRQAKVMLVGAAMPWVGNALYVAGLVPLPGLDLTPIAFALTGLTAVVAFLRFQILDLVPVARDMLVESMGDGVLVLDARNRVVDINRTACRFIGRDAADVIGQQASAVLAAWPDLVARYQDVPEAQSEVALDSPIGSRWLDLRISPLYDRRERLTGRLIVLHDVTARRQAEQVLQQYAGELEARNTELDAYAHTVAHDLKGPLSTIIGYTSLLAAGVGKKSPEEIKATLRTVLVSSYKMRSIIDNLLLLASVRRMDDLPTGPVDMAAIVSEVRIRLSAEIAARQAEIVLPQRWPVAIGYAPWVEEVWVNYVGNALKYGADPLRIELGFDRGGDKLADPSIRFWVKDSGPGLAPEEQARLFSPFTRLEQIDAKGHGLGLSIVGRIVERLGGQVGVESKVGEGSTFWFTLPARPTAADGC
ncbi:MAG: PAS domain-containing protein [Anaerolineae bacterium]|nr:PAS domain-containing protein [Anaerolineae bacterium]